jgi:hypothetical protein
MRVLSEFNTCGAKRLSVRVSSALLASKVAPASLLTSDMRMKSEEKQTRGKDPSYIWFNFFVSVPNGLGR